MKNFRAEIQKLSLDSANKWFEQGTQRFLSGNFQSALASCDRALQLNPNCPEAWSLRGSILDKLNRYEEAITSFDKALNLKPDEFYIWMEKGAILCDFLGKYEEALTSFDKALALKPNDHRIYYNQGVTLGKLNRYDEAVKSYDKTLKSNPDNHEAWDNRGVALDELNRCEEAITSFDQALKLKPDNYITWNNRGNALHQLNRYEDAISSYDASLRFNPNFHEAWSNRGGALHYLNRYEDAIASYDKALDFKPDLPEIWVGRGYSVLLSPFYNQFPSLAVGAHLSQQNHPLNQRGYLGQVITLETGLKQVVPHSKDWGYLQQALGSAHFYKGKNEKNSGHNPKADWQKARNCLELALSVLSIEEFPELRLETLQLVIRVLLAQGDNTTAQKHRKAGVKLLQTLLNQAPTAAQKQKIEAEFSGFSQIEVDLWLKVNERITALETAERFKNRCLNWILEAWKETVISPSHATMQTLCAPDTAIVYWHLSPDSLATFILTDVSNTPEVLPSNRTAQAQNLANWLQLWHKDYRDYASKKLPQTERENHPWRQVLKTRLSDLKQILQIEDLCQYLPATVQSLILVPHLDLHLLPLHTLFPDHLICTYLPSVQIGLNLREQPSQTQTYAPLLCIEDPKKDQPSMPFAQLESAIVQVLVKNATCISRNDAATDIVTNNLQKSFSTFHFTGHGAYNARTPSDSGLVLTDGLLTAKDISQLDLSSYKLIVLASCETALTGNEGINTEYVGLASAFLKAGAANVLSTLWPVDEISSAWLMIRFYQFLLTGDTPSMALRQAQHWLQARTWQQLADWIVQLSQLPNLDRGYIDILTPRANNTLKEGTIMGLDKPTKYSHPYYWAAFIMTGQG